MESVKAVFPQKKHTEQFQNIIDDINDELDSTGDEPDISNVPLSIKHEMLTNLHHTMDKHLTKVKPALAVLLKSWDTGNYLFTFAKAIEEATIEFGGLGGEDAEKIKGRSTLKYKFVKQDKKMVINHTTGQIELKANKYERLVLKQLRRLQHIKGCLNKMKHIGSDDPIKKSKLNIDIQENINKIINEHHPNDELGDLISHLSENRFTLNFQHWKIVLNIDRLDKKFNTLKISATNTTKILSTRNLTKLIATNKYPR